MMSAEDETYAIASARTPPPAHQNLDRCIPRRSPEQAAPRAGLHGGVGQLPVRQLLLSGRHEVQSPRHDRAHPGGAPPRFPREH